MYFSMYNMKIMFIVLCFICIYVTKGNREVIVCNGRSLNISCENETVIEIINVQFGPISSDQHVIGKENLSASMSTYLKQIEAWCNDKNHCYINDSRDIGFDAYENIPRLINVTYKCDYEYFGCYEDNKVRLFNCGNLTETGNMSALICRMFCKNKERVSGTLTFFGTENSDECFCGANSEYHKLNGTLYEWADTEVCNESCKMHEYETCGRHGYISVYTTNTDFKSALIKATDDPPCGYNASVEYKERKLQISRYCNATEMEDIFGGHGSTCDDVNFCTAQSALNKDFKFKKNVSKYVQLIYKCKATPSTSVDIIETSKYIGMAGGAGVVGFIFMILIVVCVRKRRRKSNQDAQAGRNPTMDLANDEQSDSTKQNKTSNVYSVVNKPKQNNAAENVETLPATDDVYADNVEGVYDVSNNPRYKVPANQDQAIYSHTVDDVYDTTKTNTQKPADDNVYDQGFHLSEGNAYDMSSI